MWRRGVRSRGRLILGLGRRCEDSREHWVEDVREGWTDGEGQIHPGGGGTTCKQGWCDSHPRQSSVRVKSGGVEEPFRGGEDRLQLRHCSRGEVFVRRGETNLQEVTTVSSVTYT